MTMCLEQIAAPGLTGSSFRIASQSPLGLGFAASSPFPAASEGDVVDFHTPSEFVCLDDIQATIDLVCAYCRRLTPDMDFTPM
jgi:hypothetical protein